MKYILILSLFYKHYKKASTLKLFLDNSLIDEIVLDKNIDPIPNFQEKHSQTIDKVAVDSYRDATWVIKRLKDWYTYTSKQLQIRFMGKQTHIKIPSKLWLYSLELNNTNKHISLNFEIHDNNYSNAFMTNSALAKIHKIGLIPENLFYDEQKILPRICKTFRRKNIDSIHISKDGKNKKINKNDLELYLGDGWITKNDYIGEYPFITGHKWKHWWFGGSKKIILPIIKKHNTFILYCPLDKHLQILYTSKQPIGHIRIDPYWFWLKYQQQIINITNEDSRNYNTQKNR